MIDISKGRYWDEGITLVDGCSPCSPGCDHCWSAAMTHRFRHELPMALPSMTNGDGKFTGIIEVHPDRLSRFKTRKPKVFAIWNDLLHGKVDRHFIEDSLTGMWFTPQNTYLILTKRPNRLNEISHLGHWPYDNVYLGLTVCNQQEADEKIPIFLQVPGKKFLSIEPMLAPMIIRKYIEDDCDCGICKLCNGQRKDRRMIDCVILGGETGPGARPMNLNWVRSIRDQCAAANVPFFFKGWGKHEPTSQNWSILKKGRELDKRTHDDLPWK